MTNDRIAAKFHAALERKNAKNREGAQHLDGGHTAQSPHGSEGHQQQFRRKSG